MNNSKEMEGSVALASRVITVSTKIPLTQATTLRSVSLYTVCGPNLVVEIPDFTLFVS